MRHAKFALCLLISMSSLLPFAALPAAQRTFVASTGLDTNPCTVTQPCRSIQAAIAVTNSAGEVIALDSAGYGPFVVNKAISIIAAPGIHAAITVSAGNGIDVFASETDVVVLRGLEITGLGGVDGIVINQAKEVHIENCTISNMGQQGIRIPGFAHVRISGSTLRANGLSGVWIPPTGSAIVLIENTRSVRNGQIGYFLQGDARTTLLDSEALDNVSTGLRNDGDSGGTPVVVVTGGEYSGNGGIGVLVNANHGSVNGFSAHGIGVSRNSSAGIVTNPNFDIANPGFTHVHASVSASHVTWNGTSGLNTGSVGSNQNWVVVSHSIFSENEDVGIRANGSTETIVNVSASTLTRNANYDFDVTNSATLNTFQNNALTGNASDIHIGSGGFAILSNKSLR